ncbi:MAG: hypothetical protein M0T84_06155 [Betaproteobacteria bacterium]|nr:hypothetical protein [Betaproteobacteria bacterium]
MSLQTQPNPDTPFYLGKPSDLEWAILAVAMTLSGRVCEETGALGRLVTSNHYISCRSLEKIAELEDPSPENPKPGDPLPYLTLEERLTLTTPKAIATLMEHHPRVFDSARQMSFPPRFFDLIDVVVRRISNPLHVRQLQCRVSIDQVAWDQVDELRIEVNKASAEHYVAEALIAEPQSIERMFEIEGRRDHDIKTEVTSYLFKAIGAARDFANAMSKHMEPETGSCGPVDDFGQLIKEHWRQ